MAQGHPTVHLDGSPEMLEFNCEKNKPASRLEWSCDYGYQNNRLVIRPCFSNAPIYSNNYTYKWLKGTQLLEFNCEKNKPASSGRVITAIKTIDLQSGPVLATPSSTLIITPLYGSGAPNSLPRRNICSEGLIT